MPIGIKLLKKCVRCGMISMESLYRFSVQAGLWDFIDKRRCGAVSAAPATEKRRFLYEKMLADNKKVYSGLVDCAEIPECSVAAPDFCDSAEPGLLRGDSVRRENFSGETLRIDYAGDIRPGAGKSSSFKFRHSSEGAALPLFAGRAGGVHLRAPHDAGEREKRAVQLLSLR